MSEPVRFDDVHVLIIDEDSDTEIVLHPAGCPVSLEFQPKIVARNGDVIRENGPHSVVYGCAVQHQLDEVGLPTHQDGWWAIEFWHSLSPGGPWGPSEHDAGLSCVALTDLIGGPS